MAAGRNAAMKVDWTKIPQALSLRGSTASALQAFKKRHDDARRRVQILSDTPQTVDFKYYRSILKNQAIVDDIEKQVNGYQVKKYDVAKQIKAIEAFEARAVEQAQETKGLVEKELGDLQKTLKNIEDARPFDELTVDEVMAAQPKIEERAKHMVSNHRWMPPGYKEKFGDLSIL